MDRSAGQQVIWTRTLRDIMITITITVTITIIIIIINIIFIAFQASRPVPLAAAACRDGGGAPPQRRLGRGQRAPPRRDSDRPRVRVTRRRQSGAVTARAETWSRRVHGVIDA